LHAHPLRPAARHVVALSQSVPENAARVKVPDWRPAVRKYYYASFEATSELAPRQKP
jgi:hypothetical protein